MTILKKNCFIDKTDRLTVDMQGSLAYVGITTPHDEGGINQVVLSLEDIADIARHVGFEVTKPKVHNEGRKGASITKATIDEAPPGLWERWDEDRLSTLLRERHRPNTKCPACGYVRYASPSDSLCICGEDLVALVPDPPKNPS